MTSRPLFHAPLYFLLNLPSSRPALELAEEVIAGGVQAIQLRAKDVNAHDLYLTARALRPLTQKAGVLLIINDRLDIAQAVGADGVHLGKEDLPLDAARMLAPELLIGISCYGSIERAQIAVAGGADYVAFGAFYNSPTKPQAPTISLKVLEEARNLPVPRVVIGGITENRVPELMAAGADSVAVISAIQEDTSPEQASHRFSVALTKALQKRAQGEQPSESL